MSLTRIIVETRNGLRQLDVADHLVEGGDMWDAIGAYDDAHGTSFWDAFEPRDIVEVDIHDLHVGIPALTMDDLKEVE